MANGQDVKLCSPRRFDVLSEVDAAHVPVVQWDGENDVWIELPPST